MNNNIKNAIVDGKLVDIITQEEYSNKWKLYSENPSIASSTALEINKPGTNETYLLPIRGRNDDRPGIYDEGAIYKVRYPKDDDKDNYLEDKLNVVDFKDTENIKDFLNKSSQIRDMESIVLTDIDSVFKPPMLPNDSVEMRAFKMAVEAKHCDLNKYAPRFGDNYLNDKRILKTPSITMNKLISISKNLDIEVELTLRNSSPDVANPMDREIKVILTGNDNTDNT